MDDVRVIDSATAIGSSASPIVRPAHPASASPAPPASPAPHRMPKHASSPPITMIAAPMNPARPRSDPRSPSVRTPVLMPAAGRVVRMSITSATMVINMAAAPNRAKRKITLTRNGSRAGGYSIRSSCPSNSAGISAVEVAAVVVVIGSVTGSITSIGSVGGWTTSIGSVGGWTTSIGSVGGWTTSIGSVGGWTTSIGSVGGWTTSIGSVGGWTTSIGSVAASAGSGRAICAPQSWQNFCCSETSIPQRGHTIRRL